MGKNFALSDGFPPIPTGQKAGGRSQPGRAACLSPGVGFVLQTDRPSVHAALQRLQDAELGVGPGEAALEVDRIGRL